MENSFKNTFLLKGKTASIEKNIKKKKKKMVANSNNEGFNLASL